MNLLETLPGTALTERHTSASKLRLRRSIVYGLLVCVAVSMVFAVLPHAVSYFAYGSSGFLANGDDHYYLAIARLPYFGEWGLRDPFSPPSAQVPTLHAWAMFVPFAKATALLGLNATMIALVMRVIGSILLAVSLFFLFYRLLSSSPRRLFWTILCTLVCLTDAGFITGRSFIANFQFLMGAYRGTEPGGGTMDRAVPDCHAPTESPHLAGVGGYRLLTPTRSWKYIAGTAALLALCISQYFFFWTAAIAAASADIALSWLAAVRNRVSWLHGRSGPILIVLMVGIIGAAPELIHKSGQLSNVRHRDTIERAQPGLHLLPGDPMRKQNVFNPVGLVENRMRDRRWRYLRWAIASSTFRRCW